MLAVGREVVQRLAARHRVEDGPLAAGNALGGVERAGDPVRGGDHDAVIVAEHDVAGRDVDAAAADRLLQGRPGDRAAGRRDRAPREHGEPEPPEPGDVAAQPVDDDPEKFRRVDAKTINYRFTVEDPETFTAPFTGEIPFTAMTEPMYEYACHEGNYALANVLSGARNEEKRNSTKQQ